MTASVISDWGLYTLSNLSCIDVQPPQSFLSFPRPPSHHPSSITSVSLVSRPPITFAINTLLVIRYSSILSTCPNHINTLWSSLLAYSLSIPALLRTSSFLTRFIRDTPTKLLKHFISRTFTLLLIPHASAPYNAVGTNTPSYRHFLAYPQSSITLHTFQRSPRSIPLVHSVYHILHQLPLATI